MAQVSTSSAGDVGVARPEIVKVASMKIVRFRKRNVRNRSYGGVHGSRPTIKPTVWEPLLAGTERLVGAGVAADGKGGGD
jgi:hypothetical protein